MSAEKVSRQYPCMCISCPECGSIFQATAMKSEYHIDHEANQNLLKELCEYAEQGYNISFKNRDEFELNFCEHVKK